MHSLRVLGQTVGELEPENPNRAVFGNFSNGSHFQMVRARKLTFGDLIDLDTNSNLTPHLVPNMATRRRGGVSVKNLQSQKRGGYLL